MPNSSKIFLGICIVFSLLLPACGGGGGGGDENVGQVGTPSQSGTIQISEDDERVFVINKVGTGQTSTRNRFVPNGSLTVMQVRLDGKDDNTVLSEIIVGRDPRSVSVSLDGKRAYVSNGADSTVSVIDLDTFTVITDIQVGSEPRGTALSPSGKFLYVANFSDATLSVIDTDLNAVIKTVDLTFQDEQVEDPIIIQNPYAVAVSNDDDAEDDDETIYVADFYGRGIQTTRVDRREAFDSGKEGRIAIVDGALLEVIDLLRLNPVKNTGFSADRSQFAGTVFSSGSGQQGAFFNQLQTFAFDIDTNLIYVPSIAASPEPPVKFDVNVQSLVGIIDGFQNVVRNNRSFNVNSLIKADPKPNPPFNANNPDRLDRTFAGDMVSMAIRNTKVLFVSRSGSFVIKGFVDAIDGTLQLDKQANGAAIRIQTGNIPTGVVINSNASRAYVNAEIDQTVTAINLNNNNVINTIEGAALPAIGTEEHQILLGKLAFYTGQGVPADNLLNVNVRNVNTSIFRNIASQDNWSSCASCHPDGLSDGVTWIFATGPRQTIPLDGTFSQNDETDQRALNWNAVRSSVTDFNNTSRNVQGGFGFTIGAFQAAQIPNVTPPGNPFTDVQDAFLVENHGPDQNFNVPDLGNRQGISDSLNLITLYVQKGIRTLNRPSELDDDLVTRGKEIFEQFCAECHGGDKWTSSQVLWNLPLFFKGGQNNNNIQGITLADQQARSVSKFNNDLIIRNDIGTLDVNNEIEVRGLGGTAGLPSLGVNSSFNPPSLLGVANSAPYGHHGRAETLEEVFDAVVGGDPGEPGIAHPTFDAEVQQNLDAVIEFLKSIDEDQDPIPLDRDK